MSGTPCSCPAVGRDPGCAQHGELSRYLTPDQIVTSPLQRAWESRCPSPPQRVDLLDLLDQAAGEQRRLEQTNEQLRTKVNELAAERDRWKALASESERDYWVEEFRRVVRERDHYKERADAAERDGWDRGYRAGWNAAVTVGADPEGSEER